MALADPAIVNQHLRYVQRDAPRRIKAMLGLWVSEFEPIVVEHLPGIPIGLSAAGHCPNGVATSDRIYIRYEDTFK